MKHTYTELELVSEYEVTETGQLGYLVKTFPRKLEVGLQLFDDSGIPEPEITWFPVSGVKEVGERIAAEIPGLLGQYSKPASESGQGSLEYLIILVLVVIVVVLIVLVLGPVLGHEASWLPDSNGAAAFDKLWGWLR